MGIKISKVEHLSDQIRVDFRLDGVQNDMELVFLIFLNDGVVSEYKIYRKDDLKTSGSRLNSSTFVSYTFNDFINSNPLNIATTPNQANLGTLLKTLAEYNRPSSNITGNERLKISTNLMDELRVLNQRPQATIRQQSPSVVQNSDIRSSVKRITLDYKQSVVGSQCRSRSNSPTVNQSSIKKMVLGESYFTEFSRPNRGEIKESILINRVSQPMAIPAPVKYEQANSLPNPTRYGSLDIANRASTIRDSGNVFKKEFFDQNHKLVYVKYSVNREGVEPIRTVHRPDSTEIVRERFNSQTNTLMTSVTREIKKSVSPPKEIRTSVTRIVRPQSSKPATQISYPTTIYQSQKEKFVDLKPQYIQIFRQKKAKMPNRIESFNIFRKPHVDSTPARPSKPIKITETNSRKHSDISINGTDLDKNNSFNNSLISRDRPSSRHLVDAAKYKLDRLMADTGRSRREKEYTGRQARHDHKGGKNRPIDFIILKPELINGIYDSGVFTKSKNTYTENNTSRFKDLDAGTIYTEDQGHGLSSHNCHHCCCCNHSKQKSKVISEALEDSLKKYINDVTYGLQPKQSSGCNHCNKTQCKSSGEKMDFTNRYRSNDVKRPYGTNPNNNYNGRDYEINILDFKDSTLSGLKGQFDNTMTRSYGKYSDMNQYLRDVRENPYLKTSTYDSKIGKANARSLFFAYK